MPFSISSYIFETLTKGISDWDSLKDLIGKGKSGIIKEDAGEDDRELSPADFWNLAEKQAKKSWDKTLSQIAAWFTKGVPKLLKDCDVSSQNVIAVSLGDVPEVFNLWASRVQKKGKRILIGMMDSGEYNVYGDYHKADKLESGVCKILAKSAPVENGMALWQLLIALGARSCDWKAVLKNKLKQEQELLLFCGPNQAPYTYIATLTEKGMKFEKLTIVWK